MSIKVQSYVWEHSRAKGSALLLLLAIADHCHDDGKGAWAGVESLSKKCRQSERNTQRLLRILEKMGELVVDVGAGPHGCNAYEIPMRGDNLSGVTSGASASGDNQGQNDTPDVTRTISNQNHHIADFAKTAKSDTPKVRFVPKSLIDTEDKPKKKEPKHRDLPIAVQKFVEVRGKTPRKETWAMIQDTVGNDKKSLDLWKDVLVKYAALGWNPMNVAGALEWFKKGELPHMNGKDKSNGGDFSAWKQG